MNALAPKLVLTPLLVASTSLAGRRWGPALSGWLIAMPLTSGPIALFIAVEAGTEAARQAASGSLLGASGQVAFAAAYTLASRPLGWGPSLVAATLAFGGVALLVPPMSSAITYGLLAVAIAVFLGTVGRRPGIVRDAISPPAWDIPARVVVATALVLAISSLAPILDGRFSGILATFPVYAAVIATFAHTTRGPAEASAVLRGLVTGLLGFGAFFLALGALLGVAGVALGFAGALTVGAIVQTATLPLVRRAAHDEGPMEPSGLE